jgi:hypothetical protein
MHSLDKMMNQRLLKQVVHIVTTGISSVKIAHFYRDTEQCPENNSVITYSPIFNEIIIYHHYHSISIVMPNPTTKVNKVINYRMMKGALGKIITVCFGHVSCL